MCPLFIFRFQKRLLLDLDIICRIDVGLTVYEELFFMCRHELFEPSEFTMNMYKIVIWLSPL